MVVFINSKFGFSYHSTSSEHQWKPKVVIFFQNLQPRDCKTSDVNKTVTIKTKTLTLKTKTKAKALTLKIKTKIKTLTLKTKTKT